MSEKTTLEIVQLGLSSGMDEGFFTYEEDVDTFKIVESSLKLQELVEDAIKECKRNAGGMVYGMALEELIRKSKNE